MQAGPLRHRVSIIRESSTNFDSRGQISTNTTTISTVWASIETLTGREGILARQIDASLSHKVTIRYSTDVSSLGPNDWIEFGTRRMDIAQVANIDQMNERMELFVAEELQ